MEDMKSEVITEKNDGENQLFPATSGSVSTMILNSDRASTCVEDDVSEKSQYSEDTTCGIPCFRCTTLQKFANKKAYVVFYGILGCAFSASFAYFNGTITTMERRFKISSKTTGFIASGTDISEMFGLVFCYYAGKGHRPRWMAVGGYLMMLYCCLSMLPHFLYGPGDDALQLTTDYNQAHHKWNSSESQYEDTDTKFLCHQDESQTAKCVEADGHFAPPAILFIAHLISGVGCGLFGTLGISYMDDNIEKAQTPALISFSYFLRLLGPAAGYSLASFALKFYISPTMTPVITAEDPRWFGAWWMGWIVLAVILFIISNIVGLYPRALPRVASKGILVLEDCKMNKHLAKDTVVSEGVNDTNQARNQRILLQTANDKLLETGEKLNYRDSEYQRSSVVPASLKDMLRTFRRLLTNKTLMCNNFAAVFYVLGGHPYWIFMPKYIETQYKQSASFASLVTGTVGLVFSAVGILSAGLVISKFKPKARYLAVWNVIIGAISVMAIISFVFLGCSASDESAIMSDLPGTQSSCSENCHCDYVTYNPVCSEDKRTFISACHAGCQTLMMESDGTKIYSNCSCIESKYAKVTGDDINSISRTNWTTANGNVQQMFHAVGIATSGPCPVDCQLVFYFFLTIICFLKFFGATGRASNFLVAIRCVAEMDKTVSVAMGMTFVGFFAFIPSPLLFGSIIDNTCLVWGKTCSGTGNCWLYDSASLRYSMNLTAAGFVTIGTLFDVGVWYLVKDLKIFDEDIG